MKNLLFKFVPLVEDIYGQCPLTRHSGIPRVASPALVPCIASLKLPVCDFEVGDSRAAPRWTRRRIIGSAYATPISGMTGGGLFTFAASITFFVSNMQGLTENFQSFVHFFLGNAERWRNKDVAPFRKRIHP